MFGRKRFARMRGFGGFAVRGEFVTGSDGDFSFSRRALAENREEGFDDSREMIRLERF